jgi:hypothetical protein
MTYIRFICSLWFATLAVVQKEALPTSTSKFVLKAQAHVGVWDRT